MTANLIAATAVWAAVSMTVPQPMYLEGKKAWSAHVAVEDKFFAISVREQDCRRGHGVLYLHPPGKTDVIGSIRWSHREPLQLASMLCANIPDRSVFEM